MAQVGLLEDNVRIARLCATMLQYAGHQVTVYDHASECLQALLPGLPFTEGQASLSQTTCPGTVLPVDVLILDLHLPDIDGLEVLRYLQASPQTRQLPLIFCTAAAQNEIEQALDIAPHASLIEKPFTFKDLTTTISSVLPSATK
ncbi:response regulator [Ktedonospora formicarum]|uniref:Response regulatory domain-containing protein n=1 Tax=Ktedonospora formicarum TaxID=2778364 RepID=A0A8J3HZF8_9CHLR|nr:response regulator [Ktedonospora formicarum]GHO42754.1 hypothetical protein KSX_09170 [Ktedonospora formicarum]